MNFTSDKTNSNNPGNPAGKGNLEQPKETKFNAEKFRRRKRPEHDTQDLIEQADHMAIDASTLD